MCGNLVNVALIHNDTEVEMDELPWMVKKQTLLDKETGATLRFGDFGSHSNLIYLQIFVPALKRGVTISFNRHTGEAHGFTAHTVMDAPPAAPIDPMASVAPPEPFQKNAQARVLGATPGVQGAAPGTVVEFPAPLAGQGTSADLQPGNALLPPNEFYGTKNVPP